MMPSDRLRLAVEQHARLQPVPEADGLDPLKAPPLVFDWERHGTAMIAVSTYLTCVPYTGGPAPPGAGSLITRELRSRLVDADRTPWAISSIAAALSQIGPRRGQLQLAITAVARHAGQGRYDDRAFFAEVADAISTALPTR